MSKATSLLGGLIVIAIAIVFITSFQPGGGQNQLKEGPDCMAEVLGRCIPAKHYSTTYGHVAPRETSETEQTKYQEMVRDALIERELLLAEAERLGISVSEEELTSELTGGRLRLSYTASQMANGQRAFVRLKVSERFLDRKTKQFSAEQYKKSIAQFMQMSETEYREFQRAEIIAERMRFLIMNRVRVSEAEAFDIYAEKNTTAKVKQVKFHKDFYVPFVDRSPKAVAAWGEKNAVEIDKELEQRRPQLVEGCRELSQVLVSLPRGATADDKKNAEARIEAAKKRIEGGEAFADVARSVSDHVTALDGGSLGCVTKAEAQSEPALLAAVFEPKEAGFVKEPITTAQGLHLFTIDKIVSGPEAEKATRAGITHGRYIAAESKRMAGEAAKEVQAAAKGGKSLEEALKAHVDALPKPDFAAAPPKTEEGDKPKGDEAPKGDKPKDDKPKGDEAPKGDKPKDDKPKDDKPKGDEAPKDEPAPAPEPDKPQGPKAMHEALTPKVESSVHFKVNEDQAFPDVDPMDGAPNVAFGLEKPGDIAEKVLPLRSGGFMILALEEKEEPSDDDWKQQRGLEIEELRRGRQLEGLVEYMKRLRATHQAEIKISTGFFKGAEGSAKPEGSAPPPAP